MCVKSVFSMYIAKKYINEIQNITNIVSNNLITKLFINYLTHYLYNTHIDYLLKMIKFFYPIIKYKLYI